MSKKYEKICFEIKYSSFVNKKIKEDKNTNSDKFALWLLVFSMLLFIFSLYKTFYLNQWHIDTQVLDTDNLIFEEINNEETNNKEVATSITKDTKIDAKSKNKQKKANKTEIVINNSDNIIKSFYDKINNRNYNELTNFADKYMKKSSMFKL